MPLAAKKKKGPDPDAMYVAWESFGTTGADLTIRAGTKLRGDHEAVQGWPQFFMPADTPDDEVDRHRQQKYAEELSKVAASSPQTSGHDVQIPERPEPLRAEDTVVAIRRAGVVATGKVADPTGQFRTVNPGDKLPRDHPMVKRDPEAFVPVMNDIPRDRAVVARQQLGQDDGEGNVRTVHAGQWIDRDDPLAQVNPHMVKRVGFE